MKLIIEKAENGFILVLADGQKVIFQKQSDLIKRVKTEINKDIELLEEIDL